MTQPSWIPRTDPQFLLGFLLAACITRLWLMPLPSSFWVDEMATVFVVHHGPNHPSFAVAPQVPDSIYYQLPRAAESLFGFSEVAYRLPSVLLMAIALFLIARLAARLIHPGAAWFAVFVCLSMRGINDQAADARPYALGTCVAAASLWFLIRWLDSARWWDAALFIVLAALLWRVHLLFWPFYVVLATATRLVRLAAPRNARRVASDSRRIRAARCCAGPGADRRAESLSPRHLARHRRAADAARPAHLAQIRRHPDLRRGRFRSEPAVSLAARSRLRPYQFLGPDRRLVALAAAGSVCGLSRHRQQHVRRALPLSRSARSGAGRNAGRLLFHSAGMVEAAITGLRRRRAAHVGPMARAAGRCITARTGGWRRTPSISGPRTIRPRPCSAPARSSKPARRSGSRPMRYPVFSTAICRFILFAASPTCCRLKIRPKPSATSKAWPMARSPHLAASSFTADRARFGTGATGFPYSPSFPPGTGNAWGLLAT